MKPLTRSLCWSVTALTVLLVGFGRADDKPKDKPEEPKKPTVMQRKLSHSQKVLEGLATNDFAKIVRADGLLECLNDVTWKINETEKYLFYSIEFRHRADSLKKAAKAKNTDAAALAYVDMTLTCVRCHQHLREDR